MQLSNIFKSRGTKSGTYKLKKEEATRESLSIVKIVDTTSSAEEENGSRHYTLVVPLGQILKLNVEENLRIGYTHPDSSRSISSIHRDIRNSFMADRKRFIQRHSGFVVIANDLILDEDEDDGTGKVFNIYLEKPSLINGAQTQQILRELIDQQVGDVQHLFSMSALVRVELIIEKNKNERLEIAIARNNSINVAKVSKLGKAGYLDDLESSLKDVMGEDFELAKSETDHGIKPAMLIALLRAVTPHALYPYATFSPVACYASAFSHNSRNLTEYKNLVDGKGTTPNKKILVKFFKDFAGIVYREYIYWATHPEWAKLSTMKTYSGKFIKKRNNELGKDHQVKLGIILPLLHGLRNFVEHDADAGVARFKYPDGFSESKYIRYIANQCRLRTKDCDTHVFGKSKFSYIEATNHILQEYGTVK